MSSYPKKLGINLLYYFWNKGYTPFGLLRTSGSFGTKAFLNFYLKKRM